MKWNGKQLLAFYPARIYNGVEGYTLNTVCDWGKTMQGDENGKNNSWENIW